MFSGTDLAVPYGTYRVSVFDKPMQLATTTVSVVQSEAFVRIGISLVNCCLNMHGLTWFPGAIEGVFTDIDDEARFTASLLPIWANNFGISVRVGKDGAFNFGPIDYGEYIVVLSRYKKVIAMRQVSVTEFGPTVSVEF